MSLYACPRCGSRTAAVPVWESKAAFVGKQRPDQIGCTDCRELVRYGR